MAVLEDVQVAPRSIVAPPHLPLDLLLEQHRGGDLSEAQRQQIEIHQQAFGDWERSSRALGLVDLAEIMREGVKEPEMLVEGLIAKGVHHIVYGTKESAKTWLCLGAAIQVMAQGGKVLWIDEEMGSQAFAERLHSIQVPVEMVEEHLTFSEFASFDTTLPHRALWNALLQEVEPALVVIDAHTEVLASADLNENYGTDIAKWHMSYMAPALALGATTVVIDHTGHGDQTRAVGSRHKGAQSKVELLVTRKRALDRETVGLIEVQRTKNTIAAAIPEKQAFELGGTPFRLERVTGEIGGTSDEVQVQRRILEVLAGRDDRPTKTTLVEVVGGNKAETGRQVKVLEERGLITYEKHGLAHHYTITPTGREQVSGD